MKCTKILLPILLIISSLIINSAYAGMAVIINPGNNAAPSEAEIKRLYLAKAKSFSDGTLAIPLNHQDSSDARKNFDKAILGKSESQMKSYWAKLVFTGKATPLKQVTNDDEVLELVAKNPSAIGYIDSSKVNDSVKVIHTF